VELPDLVLKANMNECFQNSSYVFRTMAKNGLFSLLWILKHVEGKTLVGFETFKLNEGYTRLLKINKT
jgi:hypothetical protein